LRSGAPIDQIALSEGNRHLVAFGRTQAESLERIYVFWGIQLKRLEWPKLVEGSQWGED
jgi:hypothetical protein